MESRREIGSQSSQGTGWLASPKIFQTSRRFVSSSSVYSIQRWRRACNCNQQMSVNMHHWPSTVQTLLHGAALWPPWYMATSVLCVIQHLNSKLCTSVSLTLTLYTAGCFSGIINLLISMLLIHYLLEKEFPSNHVFLGVTFLMCSKTNREQPPLSFSSQ